jgi:hypothetical protein
MLAAVTLLIRKVSGSNIGVGADSLSSLKRMVSSGMLRRVALVRTDVAEEPGASFIRVTRIGELGTTQAATSNRRTKYTKYFFAAYVGC